MIGDLDAITGRQVSRETSARLELYADLLRAENENQNLIAKSTIGDIWTRHLLDSAQLLRFAPRPESSWLDIGSGAGLPGIVLAMLSGGPVTMVEPRRLRADFLRHCVRELHLAKATVIHGKAENVRGMFDTITARAVAPAPDIFRMAVGLSHPGTVWALPKGRSAKSELDEALRTWQGSFRLEASLTDAEASILVATGVRRRIGPGESDD